MGLILAKNGLVPMPAKGPKRTSTRFLGTISSNLLHYGYILSKDAFASLVLAGDDGAKDFWRGLEPVLQEITGANLKMGEVVVYKNFPAEVLEMDRAEYWGKQICMYWGMPNEWFTQAEVPRDALFDKLTPKVLQLANLQLTNDNSARIILDGLLGQPVRWTPEQSEFVLFLSEILPINPAKIPFKENLVTLVASLIERGVMVKLGSATDVLRLGIGLSGGDVSQATPSKFISFNRKTRKYLLGLLDGCENLEEDMARDKNKWKKFIRALHPGDYAFKKVQKAYDRLYNNKVKSWNSRVEKLLAQPNRKVLGLLEERPGEFVRRLRKLSNIFPVGTNRRFEKVAPRLTVAQLLKTQSYLGTIGARKWRTFAPKGSWSKVQVIDNKIKLPFADDLAQIIRKALKKKLGGMKIARLDDSTKLIKLQTNGADLTPYGRGTVFPIPENIKFIRSASYWKCKRGYGNTWFDNGWNFFDADWKDMGACCWSNPQYTGNRGQNYWYSQRNVPQQDKSAIFSGDPTNSKTSDGRACQMIDIYPERLLAQGVRYAVWNILCYSRIKFSDAGEVFGGLQWGEEPQAGELFEPSRCQLAFQLTGDAYTKYVLYIDLKERKVVYMDSGLKASTSSADSNGPVLQEKMPAFVEYLDTLPSVYDLFEHCPESKKGIVASYTDKGETLKGEDAYIFRQINEKNKFKQIDLNKLLI